MENPDTPIIAWRGTDITFEDVAVYVEGPENKHFAEVSNRVEQAMAADARIQLFIEDTRTMMEKHPTVFMVPQPTGGMAADSAVR